MRTRHLLFFPLFLLLLTVGVRGERAEQLPDGWPVRRPLQFTQAVSDAPGVNIAVSEFYCDGRQKNDASDLRVTTPDRTIVPHRVLQFSQQDDFIRLAFETRSDGPYYVWWGNPNATKPATDLEINRGILVEIYRMPPGRRDNIQAVEKLFEKAPLLGALFIPEIFMGHNPLSDEWGVMFRYRGQFKIDKPIKADFAFTTSDTGSLSIDGTTIATAFRERFQRRVREPKSVDLSTGWHTMEVMQANVGNGGPGVAVVWRRPSDKNYAAMPQVLFPAVAQARAGTLENVGGGGAVDFSIVPESEVFSPPDTYLQHYIFDAKIPADAKPKITWDFGNGQVITGNRPKVAHIFMAPGVYSVTLKLDEQTTTRRITVKERMYSRFPKPPETPAKTAVNILSAYNKEKLTGIQAFRGYQFIQEKTTGSDAATIAAWGKAWLSTQDRLPGTSDKGLFDETFDLAKLLESQGDYRAAAEMFRLAARKNNGAGGGANLMRYSVMTTCDYVDDATAALQEAQNWKPTEPQQRTAQVAILYAAIAKAGGGGDAAATKLIKTTLDQLQNPNPQNGGGNFNDVRIRQGVFARNVENYIRTNEFDTAIKLLNEWELEFPEALWDGFTRILRVKLLLAEKRPLIAARLALTHARANPSGVYAAELLYRASQSFELANEPTQAKAAKALLASKYPESPYARGEMK
ncbi:MAG: PKD domain-containing protein [Phycisphaerales bacterium]|nr:PKD domain-containing protein [Phycisphaerales bacterium]